MLTGSSVEPRVAAPLRGLLNRLNDAPPADPDQAVALLRSLTIGVDSLRPWFDYDHSPCNGYGRILAARGDTFELMVMSWAPRDYSAIHDHGAAEWGAVRCFGPADHREFAITDHRLAQKQQARLRSGDVLPVDNTLIHLMGNPTDTPFITLHLYGRSEAAELITGNARIFDLLEQQIQYTDGGVFFCLPERAIHRREPCPPADTDTTLLHHRLMLSRIERMQIGKPTADLSDRAARLRKQIDQLTQAREPTHREADQ